MGEETDKGPPPITVTIALAPDGDAEAKNQSCSIMIVLKPEKKLTVAQFCRRMIEDTAAMLFLQAIANRGLNEDSVTPTAIELIYGNGVRTIVQRAALKGKLACY